MIDVTGVCISGGRKVTRCLPRSDRRAHLYLSWGITEERWQRGLKQFLVMDSGGTMHVVGFCGKWAAWSPSALLSMSMYDLGHSFHKLSFEAFRAP